MKRVLAVLAAGAVSAAAGAPVAAAAAATYVTFRTPSGNIACGYSSAFDSVPAGLRCDVASSLRNPVPKRPRRCDLDFGDSIAIGRRGRPVLLCHGDTVRDPHARVLAYGQTWRRDGFTCRSQPVGLRCSNPSGHGFFLSRERWYTF